MGDPDHPTPEVLGDVDPNAAPSRPPAPRVTPEPAPADTVLIAIGVGAGIFGTLVVLAAWFLVRRRRS